MKTTPFYEKSTLALSNRALVHLRDFRLLDIRGLTLDEATRLRLGQHLADAAEKFLAAPRAPTPRGAQPSDGTPLRSRLPPRDW